ncbi:hypothetical protein KA005_32300, partial [bacterium]|nr:hypothetical protein [bacterium]
MKNEKIKMIAISLLVIAAVVSMSGCLVMTGPRVVQPATAFAGETIEIYIHASTDSDDAEWEYPLGAVKIPNDWTVINCTYDGDYSGTMTFNAGRTGDLEGHYAPSGPDYKWWAAMGPQTTNQGTGASAVATLIVQVGEPGEYLIDYRVGDVLNTGDYWYDFEEDVPITVLAVEEPDLEYGDTPDPTYPSLLASDGARHNPTDTEWLGLQSTGDWKDFEPDAKVPDLDIPFDDGSLTNTIT